MTNCLLEEVKNKANTAGSGKCSRLTWVVTYSNPSRSNGDVTLTSTNWFNINTSINPNDIRELGSGLSGSNSVKCLYTRVRQCNDFRLLTSFNPGKVKPNSLLCFSKRKGWFMIFVTAMTSQFLSLRRHFRLHFREAMLTSEWRKFWSHCSDDYHDE